MCWLRTIFRHFSPCGRAANSHEAFLANFKLFFPLSRLHTAHVLPLQNKIECVTDQLEWVFLIVPRYSNVDDPAFNICRKLLHAHVDVDVERYPNNGRPTKREKTSNLFAYTLLIVSNCISSLFYCNDMLISIWHWRWPGHGAHKQIIFIFIYI